MDTKIVYQNLSDSDLVTCIVNNDFPAIEYFLFNKCGSLFSYLKHNIFYDTIAENELRNEFFIYLEKDNWKSLRTFQGKSSLLTWTYLVAFRFFLKKKDYFVSKDNTLVEDISRMQELTSDNDFTQNITKFELYDAIKKMRNEKYRYIMLCELQGITTEEIAHSLEITQENVYTLKVRARKQLLLTLNG